MDDLINYMGYLWISSDDGVVTIGVDEEAVVDLTGDLGLSLPDQDDVVMPGKICGEIESESGTLNIYSPIAGTVLEINEAVLENPSLLLEDPMDEGWLIKIEAESTEKLDAVIRKLSDEGGEDIDEEFDGDVDDDEEGESSEEEDQTA